eukprot:6486323-Amphidinium_carterae.1
MKSTMTRNWVRLPEDMGGVTMQPRQLKVYHRVWQRKLAPRVRMPQVNSLRPDDDGIDMSLPCLTYWDDLLAVLEHDPPQVLLDEVRDFLAFAKHEYGKIHLELNFSPQKTEVMLVTPSGIARSVHASLATQADSADHPGDHIMMQVDANTFVVITRSYLYLGRWLAATGTTELHCKIRAGQAWSTNKCSKH